MHPFGLHGEDMALRGKSFAYEARHFGVILYQKYPHRASSAPFQPHRHFVLRVTVR